MSQASNHCCEAMAGYIDPKCADHPDPRDCEDALIFYDPRFDSYALYARLGSTWMTVIKFCPWCGDAKRDLTDTYFERTDALGIDLPLTSDVPEAFQSDKWWRDEKL